MQAQQTAGRLGKPEISSLDVLVALLEQEGGILSPILRKASCDPGLLLQAAQREVSHEPTQSGATTQPQMGQIGRAHVLNSSHNVASRMPSSA